jgi:phosphatidylglycerophosphatase A
MKRARDFFIKTLATGFGLGLMPVAPGTFGTLLGIPFAYFLHFKGPMAYMLATFIFSLFAIVISEMAGPLFGESDSPKIVIDEVAGFLVTMTWIPVTWQGLLAGFILFRFFDALKPGPIGYLDRKVKGGLGVVVDDLAAGIAANIILQIIYVNSVILGARLL